MEFTAFDLMLLGIFFISYNVLALVQVALLYSRRWLAFAVLAAGTVALSQAFGHFDYAGFCAERQSAIVCSPDGRGLTGFALVWVYVSAAMLTAYIVLKGIRRLRRNR